MKNIVKTLDLGPYPCKLRVTMLDKLPDCGGRTYTDNHGLIYIDYEKSCFPDLVTHESVHAKQFLEKYIATTLDKESEAYLLQHIVTWTLNAFKEFILCSNKGNSNKKDK